MSARTVFAAALCTWAFALAVSARAPQPAPPQKAPAPSTSASGQATPAAPTNQDCFDCHDDDSVTREKDGTTVTVKPAVFNASAHESLACVDCHAALATVTDFPHEDTLPKVDCASCHDEEVAKFADSIHGKLRLKSGLVVAPTCSDCHGKHDIRKPDDPGSRVARPHVPATCGKCHEGIARQFGAGVHGKLLAEGKMKGPACQTCHTAHDIQRTDRTSWQLAVIGECGTCHGDRIATFRDTFHGQVTNLGFRVVAGCADCHGAHEILPASDPRSPVSPGRLIQTCGKCHANANANFVKYDPHANKHDPARNPLLFYASRFMSVLLFGVFGVFGVHTSLWFTKEVRERRARRNGDGEGGAQ